jgi:hypothetical protein
MSNNNNSGNWNSGYYNSGDYNSGDYNSGDYNSGDYNSGDCNSGYYNSGDYNSGYRNSGYRNSGDCNSGNRNSGNRNSGYRNSGDGNSGYGNSADRQTGIFNNQEGTIRCFNKDTNLKWSDIDHPSFDEFYLNRWVEEGNMTNQEKVDNPHFYTTKGYLKSFTYEEAWANYWRETSEEDRQRVLNLPNFDAEVFKDITGIDIDKPEKVETITIGGIEYNKEEVEQRLKDITPVN